MACALGFVVASSGCRSEDSAIVNAAGTSNLSGTYQTACARCHGSNGAGVEPADASGTRPRDFTDSGWQMSISDESIARVVHDGKGAMPAFGGVLSDTEIAAAVTSVRSFAR